MSTPPPHDPPPHEGACLLPLRAEGSRPPLICLPPASGSGLCYLGLARLLPTDQPVHAVDATDPRVGAGSVRSIADLGVRYAHLVGGLDAGPDGALEAGRAGRCSLLGWSMGGAVAFETARALQSAGRRVDTLILLDAVLPAAPVDPDPVLVAVRFLQDVLGGELDAGQVDMLRRAAAATPGGADGAAGQVLVAARRAGLLPDDVDLDWLGGRLDVFHAHVSALHRYRPRETYPGRTVLLAARGTSLSDLDWAPHLRHLETRSVAAPHNTLLQGPGLPLVAEAVADCLAGRTGAVPPQAVVQ